MFPEYRELITELKNGDAHFQRLFNEHNELDKKITNMEKNPITGHRYEEIETLKKEKLHLKDQLYKILLKVSKQTQG
ncbi:MAG: hypothetical protein CSA45_04885 [Gammaproteobacteria bacterium]|nr:MAG: hypothetical protein CSA45_04885 [Gammaproteobacteria bacterium]